MIDIVSSIRKLTKEGQKLAIARVVNTWRSSPRPIGSALIVTGSGEMIGSVSGGCVEMAVVKKALRVLENGQPELARFGVSDEDAWEVGLSCGGQLDVLIQPFPEALWKEMDEMIKNDEGFVWVTDVRQDRQCLVKATGETVGDKLEKSLLNELEDAYSQGESKLSDEAGFFIHVFPQKPLMLLIGSAHITVELTELAQIFGFQTLLIDPRNTFATSTRFKIKPDSVFVEWPQEVLSNVKLDKNTYAVILSHDPKIDDEALKILLPSKVRYIGALGSKKTHSKRIERLKEYGFSEAAIDLIHAPIGIDIGSKLPREIALSVMAEIIRVKNS